MKYTVVETGPRNVAQANYKDYRIQVVTGYSIVGDNYPIHIYIQRYAPDGRLAGRPEKLALSGHADRMDEAFEAGLSGAMAEIDVR